MRKALTEKLLILGVDGMDPRVSKKYMDQGMMPNLKKFVERGAAREDLVLLGSVPTVTPPMWTTLATGATAATHGITDFWNQHPDKLDTMIYNLDSRMCRAELLWNVMVEAGKKVMVWHWPGSSWPPSSDNANLHVVDGNQPGAVNMGVATIDTEKIAIGSKDAPELRFVAASAADETGAGCVLTGLDEEEDTGLELAQGESVIDRLFGGQKEVRSIRLSTDEGEIAVLGNIKMDTTLTPIKEPKGWGKDIPGALEATVLTSGGLVRRPVLLLPDEEGIYNQLAIYKSKKAEEPFALLKIGETQFNVLDEVNVKDEKKVANRHMRLIEMAPDGSSFNLWLSIAYDVTNDHVWHPKSLFKEVVEHCGMVPPATMLTGAVPSNVTEVIIPFWQFYVPWQADCLEYLMTKKDYDVIFSHVHHVDNMGHQLWHYAINSSHWPNNDEKQYQGFIDEAYRMTDDYLGRFLPYLDQGWTIVITSDHGLITTMEHPNEIIGYAGGVNAQFMETLGYTIMVKDSQGHSTKEIDWGKSKAIANRSHSIFINLIGRNSMGIVAPEDKYALEEEIITALYRYQDPVTGKRAVELALRNKEAALLGMNGPEFGDIVYFIKEGMNAIHGDSLSTQYGYYDTSVSPIFVAAGPGIQAGCQTERVIRQVDVAPTLAVLTGVRMPKHCEGAPVYQILTEEF